MNLNERERKREMKKRESSMAMFDVSLEFHY
jgi:hypothetical protein